MSFDRARREVDELGPEPRDRWERQRWREERRGAVILLAALADNDPTLLRQAALHSTDQKSAAAVRGLLLDARRLCEV